MTIVRFISGFDIEFAMAASATAYLARSVIMGPVFGTDSGASPESSDG